MKGSQTAAFFDGELEQFRQRLQQHLSRFFPEAMPADGPDWDRLFESGMRDVRRFRLHREANITIYFNIMLSIDPDFAAAQPWALPILSNRNLHENEKVRRLVRHTEAMLGAGHTEKRIDS